MGDTFFGSPSESSSTQGQTINRFTPNTEQSQKFIDKSEAQGDILGKPVGIDLPQPAVVPQFDTSGLLNTATAAANNPFSGFETSDVQQSILNLLGDQARGQSAVRGISGSQEGIQQHLAPTLLNFANQRQDALGRLAGTAAVPLEQLRLGQRGQDIDALFNRAALDTQKEQGKQNTLLDLIKLTQDTPIVTSFGDSRSRGADSGILGDIGQLASVGSKIADINW